jgi:phosphoribosylaminoimidazole (AIR) synthetase
MGEAGATKKTRTYLQVVPEAEKEQLSRSWGDRKGETFVAAQKLGLEIEQGSSFNKVVKFTLEPGYYHFSSSLISVKDIANHDEVYSKVSEAIARMVKLEKDAQCTPLVASNVCDWDSAYAKGVGVNVKLRDAVINACISNNILLTGGETANLGDQLRKTGMSWMFTLFSRYDGKSTPGSGYESGNWTSNCPMDQELQETCMHIADNKKFEIRYVDGMPLLFVKERSQFVMTADGTGSKSIICEAVDKRTDIKCTLAMAGDDSPRDGAFPVLASIGIHAEHSRGKEQMLRNMIRAGESYQIPLVGSVFHESNDVHTYTMNGVILSEVRQGNRVGGEITAGLPLVLLYEEQRSNGITLQRRVLEETFGPEWYKVKVSDAMTLLGGALRWEVRHIPKIRSDRTLGELVSQPSTPYFRVDSLMPKELLETIKLRVNVSSGGIIGKTRRALEPLGLGAEYFALFEVPELILILQMASRLEGSKGVILDEVAYYTWGAGNGAIVGTTCPELVVDYYKKSGIRALVGGVVTNEPKIVIASRAFDSMQVDNRKPLIHWYKDPPLG